ncbi:MAG TPA: type III-A CRISPR-associated protein Csm2 [Caldilineaceae bacterium]|nr:type III-A CRISPR-associated protein Csm2 [Caldilineaceae bacterium]
MGNNASGEIRAIITDSDGAQTLVQYADRLGNDLKRNKLTTSQIRALFGEVRQIQAQWKMGGEQRALARRRLTLLKPKMAYRARKEQGQAVKMLVDELEPALDLVIAESDEEKQTLYFQHFVEFFEAILAYHKAYGGN